MKLRSQVFFTLFVVALFTWAVLSTRGWGYKASIFPLFIGIPALGMGILQLIFDLTEGKRKAKEGPSSDLEFEKEVDPATARKRAFITIAWIVGFLIGIEVLGIYISSILFVFLYLKVQSSERWPISVAMTVFSGLFIYGLFDRLLHVPFPAGVLIDLIRG
ncbi:MAG TPA: tripartite tricarboxylate transporter TctB family protein [bacterium]|nr:tripartite tricarboxylate transporter TctB family protein [bacterium]